MRMRLMAACFLVMFFAAELAFAAAPYFVAVRGGQRKLSEEERKALDAKREIMLIRKVLSRKERRSRRFERIQREGEASKEAQERRAGEEKLVTPLLKQRKTAVDRLQKRLDRRQRAEQRSRRNLR